MKTWFYITYEKDPVLCMYQLLEDYKDGDLCILPDSSDSSPAEREPEVIDRQLSWKTGGICQR